MSESQEIEIGRQMDPKIQKEYGRLYPDNDLQEYVNQIGQKLAAECAKKVEDSYGLIKLSGAPQTINCLSAYVVSDRKVGFWQRFIKKIFNIPQGNNICFSDSSFIRE